MDLAPILRSDARTFDAVRPFSVVWDVSTFALSSLIVKSGKTSILCTVSLEEGVPRWKKGYGEGG